MTVAPFTIHKTKMKYILITLLVFAFNVEASAQQQNMKNTENYTGPQLGKVQGRESITINASQEIVWNAIYNSEILEKWSPPTDSVEVYLKEGQTKEGVGTRRKIYATFGKRNGSFTEHRIEQVDGKSISFMIDSDEGLGVTKIMRYPGASMSITKINGDEITVEFVFYHKTKGFMGWLMNPMIKSNQKKQRHAALLSLKEYCESQMK